MLARPTVYLVDGNISFLQETSNAIATLNYGVKIIRSGKDFLESLDQIQPDCVVYDFNLPDLSGPALQKRLAAIHNPLPVVFIATKTTVAAAVQAMKAGAIDFLLKPIVFSQLLDAIDDAVHRHQKNLHAAAALSQFKSLTRREQEVFELVTLGLLNKQIAAHLGVAEKTVKVHRGHVMRKMTAQSVADLVRISNQLVMK